MYWASHVSMSHRRQLVFRTQDKNSMSYWSLLCIWCIL